jgi:hypothetical protein
MAKADKPQSNGSKEVICIRCAATIAPYAGREVAHRRYAHHPGQCADQAERETTVRELAGQAPLFAWRCDRIEPDTGAIAPGVCAETGTNRAEYAAHMAGHGKRPLPGTARIRLRKRAPAAKLPALEVPPFKFLRWTERKYGEWQAGVGNPLIGEAERRGQLWSSGPDPHSVWVVPFERAPWESTAQPPAPVVLYIIEPGRYTTDWSEAKRERREVNRRASYRRAA